MTPPPLEDRLHDLAAGVHAPPTPDARVAVGHRTRVLRRRRRALAAGSGVLVAVALAGAVTVARGPAPDDATVADAGGDLPAIVIELDGWEVTTAEDTATAAPSAPPNGSVQTFRTPEGADGPRIVLRHDGASDTLVAGPLDEEVMVGDVRGWWREGDDGDLVLQWQDPGVDAVAQIEATGLSLGDVVAFAEGLVAKDPAISHPAGPGDTFGFDQTADIRGLVEVELPAEQPGPTTTARHVVQSDGTAHAYLAIEPIDAVDSGGFETVADDLRSLGPSDDVTVMGRPGILVSQPASWTVAWQPSEGAVARLDLRGVDRAGVDDVIGALRRVDVDEWETLLRDRSPA